MGVKNMIILNIPPPKTMIFRPIPTSNRSLNSPCDTNNLAFKLDLVKQMKGWCVGGWVRQMNGWVGRLDRWMGGLLCGLWGYFGVIQGIIKEITYGLPKLEDTQKISKGYLYGYIGLLSGLLRRLSRDFLNQGIPISCTSRVRVLHKEYLIIKSRFILVRVLHIIQFKRLFKSYLGGILQNHKKGYLNEQIFNYYLQGYLSEGFLRVLHMAYIGTYKGYQKSKIISKTITLSPLLIHKPKITIQINVDLKPQLSTQGKRLIHELCFKPISFYLQGWIILYINSLSPCVCLSDTTVLRFNPPAEPARTVGRTHRQIFYGRTGPDRRPLYNFDQRSLVSLSVTVGIKVDIHGYHISLWFSNVF